MRARFIHGLLICAALLATAPLRAAEPLPGSRTPAARPELAVPSERTGQIEPFGSSFMREPRPGAEASVSGVFRQPDTTNTGGAPSSVSGNPGAVNIIVGTGALGDRLGVNKNGWRLGGLTINDANAMFGGLRPGAWIGQNLTIADLTFNTETAGLWDGGMFGSEFLYYGGYGPGPVVNGFEQHQGSPNAMSGSVLGFNALDGKPPIHRAELYELWYRQELADEQLVVRIGKSVPTYDFGNVVKPARMEDPTMDIPAVSSALLRPLYVNPTMLGMIPGYYNSATGLVITWRPVEEIYLQYGFFDGNNAIGQNTGLNGPRLTGHYFHIGEVGVKWNTGEGELPGRFGVGYWGQTGALTTFSGETEYGAQGVYFFASQRLSWEEQGSNNGLSSYYQFGATNNEVVVAQRFFGCGLTYQGLLAGRDNDSAGFGMAWAALTDNPDAGKLYYAGYGPGPAPVGSTEVVLSWYYQIELRPGAYIQPNISYIPDPAAIPGAPAAYPFTLQSVILF